MAVDLANFVAVAGLGHAHEAEKGPVAQLDHVLDVCLVGQIADHDLVVLAREILVGQDRVVCDPALGYGGVDLLVLDFISMVLLVNLFGFLIAASHIIESVRVKFDA